MNLKTKINQDLKEAIKGKREIEISTLRQLLAAILNREKEKRAKIAKEKDYYPPTALAPPPVNPI